MSFKRQKIDKTIKYRINELSYFLRKSIIPRGFMVEVSHLRNTDGIMRLFISNEFLKGK